MQNQAIFPRRGMIAVAYLVTGVVTCAATVFFFQSWTPATPVQVHPAQPAVVAPVPIVKPVAPIPAYEVVQIDTKAPGGLATRSDHRLVINRALRNVCDYFLQTEKRGATDRLSRLQAYLKAKLPDPAYTEASEIAAHYMQYLAAQKNEQQNKLHFPRQKSAGIPTPDEKADRLIARIMETSRLRQQLLGVQVTKVWFGDEEAQALQYAEQLRAPKTVQVTTNSEDLQPDQKRRSNYLPW